MQTNIALPLAAPAAIEVNTYSTWLKAEAKFLAEHRNCRNAIHLWQQQILIASMFIGTF